MGPMLRTGIPLLLLVAASACSDGQTGATSDSGSKVVSGASGDSGATPDAGACSGLMNAAQNALVPAYTLAAATRACATDSDCVVGPAGTDCTPACSGPITTQAGASALQAAIDQVNATTCVTFKKDACPAPGFPPCASGPMGLACVQGMCANFPPAAWTSFAFDQQPGANGFSTPPMCAPGATCSLWTVTPDAHVAVIDPQGTHDATLSATDFAAVDGVMRSMAFRQGEMDGFADFACDSTPGGQVVSFDVSRGTGLQGQDVSGCVLGGPTGNGLQTIFDVIKTY
jgi:hypothetical protein